MSTSAIITLICIIVGLYGSAGFCIYKSLTIKGENNEKEQ